MTRLTPHMQLSSNLVLYGQAHRRIKVCLQHPLADRLAQVAPAAAARRLSRSSSSLDLFAHSCAGGSSLR